MRRVSSCRGSRWRSTTRPWAVSSCSAAPTGPRPLQRRGDGNRLGWSLWLCGLRILGFCPNDVTMAPACRPDALVFSPLMLLMSRRGALIFAGVRGRFLGVDQGVVVRPDQVSLGVLRRS
jgi:hypothetical protein